MPKKVEEASNQVKAKILGKMFLTNKDIQLLLGVGPARASYLRGQVVAKIVDDGMMPIKKYLSTKRFVEYFQINVDYIYKLAAKESRLN